MKYLVASFLLSFTIAISAQEKVEWRGPNRDGVYNESGVLRKWPQSGPRLLWHFEGLGEGHTSATVTGKAVYITGMVNGMGTVYSFDPNGKLLWKKIYGKEWDESHNGVRSTPLFINNRLYLMSSYGQLFCLNAANGDVVWTSDLMKEFGARNITWGMTENLLHDGNMLFCTPGGSNASMIALDINTGKLIWKSKGNGEASAYCSPIIVNLRNRKLVVTIMQNSIIGFDASNGNQLWKSYFTMDPDVHPNTPVFQNGYIFCTSGYGLGSKMLKLSEDGSSVTEVWKNQTCDPKMGGAVVMNGRIYGLGDRYRKFFCLDWNTGKELYSTRDLAPGNIILNDGLLYVYSEFGTMNLVEPGTNGFNIISSFKIPYGAGTHWAHPVIRDKKLYVRHGTSLMVYDISNS
jgi:outer membrane protein assembly factor BamB